MGGDPCGVMEDQECSRPARWFNDSHPIMIRHMHTPLAIHELSWPCTPLDVAAVWPAPRPLFMLHSGRTHPRWARWSILTTPSVIYRFDGRSRWINLCDARSEEHTSELQSRLH